ncbi:hypothetical protein LCGC14_0342360 [marine sediment metagenome]|uniref:Uncharacterized protein n=1 Tax=marine sediment metagenome TaxID=412755 RepID=A0A0F9TIY1_9ZZZZ
MPVMQRDIDNLQRQITVLQDQMEVRPTNGGDDCSEIKLPQTQSESLEVLGDITLTGVVNGVDVTDLQRQITAVETKMDKCKAEGNYDLIEVKAELRKNFEKIAGFTTATIQRMKNIEADIVFLKTMKHTDSQEKTRKTKEAIKADKLQRENRMGQLSKKSAPISVGSLKKAKKK